MAAHEAMGEEVCAGVYMGVEETVGVGVGVEVEMGEVQERENERKGVCVNALLCANETGLGSRQQLEGDRERQWEWQWEWQ